MNPPDDRDFPELVEALLEGELDEAGRVRLAAILRDSPERCAELSRHLVLGHALSRLRPDRDDSEFAADTAAHIARIAGEPPRAFPEKVTGRIVRLQVRRALAIAAVAALALLPALWLLRPGGRDTAETVAVLLRFDSDGSVLSEEEIHPGRRIEETQGLARMTFANGAVLAVEAPFRLTVESAMAVKLDAGRLNAWCPESAHGFRVDTPSASVVDLGTSFGVAAGEDGHSEVMVLDGLVEVSRDTDTLRVEKGGAVAVDSPGKLREVAFTPTPFKNTWVLNHGILATRGAIVPADPDIPERVALMESDEHVLVIPERRSVPFDQPLRAQITRPGTLPGDFDGMGHILAPIPGKRLSSFLIRYDPVGTHPPDYFVRFEGEVTFDRPVLAIIAHRPALEASDPVFATASWDAEFRGIELNQLNNEPDSVTLSEDRRTVKVIFYAGASTDEVRVILEDP